MHKLTIYMYINRYVHRSDCNFNIYAAYTANWSVGTIGHRAAAAVGCNVTI